MKNEGIILLTKYPENGKTKTRLEKDLGPEITEELTKRFIIDTIKILKKTKKPILISYDLKNKLEEYTKLIGKENTYIPQKGTNLGEIITNSFEKSFELGYNKLIIIGNDTPDITENTLTTALKKLETHDSVIGPAKDGGYYIIGFKKNTFTPQAFKKIEWSTKKVFKQTINKLEKEKHKTHTLKEMQDIDTIKDLKEIVKKHKNTEFSHSETIKYLKNNKIL